MIKFSWLLGLIIFHTIFNFSIISLWAIGPYTDTGETIIDQATELEWQKSDDGKKYSWKEALVYCESLYLDGHSNWRLPNIRELNTIVDYSSSVPVSVFNWNGQGSNRITTFGKHSDAPHVFKIRDIHYWSATTRADKLTSAWTVSFNTGFSWSHPKVGNLHVRCVRVK